MKQYILLVLLTCTSFFVSAQMSSTHIPGELIVQLSENVRPDNLIRDIGIFQNRPTKIRVQKVLSDNQNILLLSFDSKRLDENKILSKVKTHPDVILAQFNHVIEMRATPNDPGFGNQWHHQNIDSELAWDITTGGLTQNGDEIVVAVIEDANYNHTDLIDNHWVNTGEIEGDGIDNDANGYVDDYHGWNPINNTDDVCCGGHGTSVNGMIGGKGNNLDGGAGVNWDVQIMNINLGSLSEASVISSYEYAYDMRNLYNTTNGAQGAFVVATNASWGVDGGDPTGSPVWCAYYDALGQVGILNCGATANNNVNVDVVGDLPTGCSSDYMIGVTATNISDVRTFSGYGTTSIDLGAPGESVYLPSSGSAYSNTSGTSFASPCVAGAIALMYSAPCDELAAQALSNPQQTADMVRNYLFQGVDPVANLATEVATGGRLNVKNSIDLLLGNCGPLPPCEPASLSLSTDCVFDDISGTVEPGITLTVSLTESFCDVSTVCYRQTGTGSYTCIDLVSEGDIVNNTNNTYLLVDGLLSATSYEVYFTTADGNSSIQTIMTTDCSQEVPGCTDPDADNYDANATFNDGSCTYPCVDVTFELLTDCWGDETSWSITDPEGTVLASAVPNSLANQQTYTWTDCLEASTCYTFTINDSYGDGLNGSFYGSCNADGNYTITDAYGNVLVQMSNANFGSQSTYEFCVTFVDLDGCTDPTACNYEPGASNDDGSCEFTSCLGCTDPNADNYDPTATVDDGSCTFSCTGVTLSLITDCWGAETSWSLEDDLGNVIQSVAANTLGNQTTFTYDWCLDDGCYTFNIEDSFSDGLAGIASGCPIDGDYTITDADGNTLVEMTETNFGAGTSHTFCINSDTPGCTDPTACNYNTAATTDDGSCEFTSCAGCTDPAACNYDATATIDDSSCTFGQTYYEDLDGDGFGSSVSISSCSAPTGAYVLQDGDCYDSNSSVYPGAPGTAEGIDNDCSGLVDQDEELPVCMGDFNGDGERNVADLLLMLGEVGCTGPSCQSDMNGDNAVNTADMVAFLGLFGSPCN